MEKPRLKPGFLSHVFFRLEDGFIGPEKSSQLFRGEGVLINDQNSLFRLYCGNPALSRQNSSYG